MATTWIFRFVMLAIALLVSVRADAHDVGLSRGEYSVSGRVVTATLTFARREVDAVAPEELAKGLLVRGDGVPCPTRAVAATPFEADGTRVTLEATCAAARVTNVEVEALFLAALPFGHRHLVHVIGPEAPSDVGLTVGRRTFSFGAAAPAAPSSSPSRFGFFVMGLEHILTGVDHLVFLLGLVLVGVRLRDSLVVVTAFTLGHSLSLALSTLGLVVPAARFIEPAIALSIVWVGVENLLVPAPSRRWRIALPFGLVHGFGFASALREIALPRAELPAALALFNLGVEVGQLAVLLPLLPLLSRLRQRPWFGGTGVRVVSLVIALAGAVWFVARVRGN